MSSGFTSLLSWTLSSAATRSHHLLQQRLSQAGVNGYDYRCLAALAAAGPLSQTKLGEEAALDPGDVTNTVRSLEGRGLVSREKDPGHGRRVLVSLTHKGRVTAKRLASTMDDAQEAVFGRLSLEERSDLAGLLKRVAPAD